MTNEPAVSRYEIVVVGSSSGGLDALKQLLEALPPDFPIPIVIVQHRSPHSKDAGLSGYYDSRSHVPVRSVVDKQAIEPGHVYIAPPDYHLFVEDGSFALSTDERVSYSRPSIDVLFDSAVDHYGDGVIGVILTGGNEDGAEGLGRIKTSGGFTIVQDPSTAMNRSMPDAALALSPVDAVLALDEIAPYLVKLAGEAR
ncbi:MAG: two-component system, chemotaxis family, protein-glutamate methylesterase/glutaminase [Actinomycetota bacterium]|jgi:two-component system chemotaxis response regulator CheB|nr:two-component system, chemotaxis family, protein-glutamate methylesterase/glutaminase [Actinomycetota bacterium]